MEHWILFLSLLDPSGRWDGNACAAAVPRRSECAQFFPQSQPTKSEERFLDCAGRRFRPAKPSGTQKARRNENGRKRQEKAAGLKPGATKFGGSRGQPRMAVPPAAKRRARYSGSCSESAMWCPYKKRWRASGHRPSEPHKLGESQALWKPGGSRGQPGMAVPLAQTA